MGCKVKYEYRVVSLIAVLVLINLVTLWLSPACLERLALVGLNVYFHFLYLQQLAWYLPKNGDLVPCVGEQIDSRHATA